jgi:hypothetical protein
VPFEIVRKSHKIVLQNIFTIQKTLMVDSDSATKSFNWQLPLYTALATFAIGFLDALTESDGILYFLLAVLLSALLFIFLLSAAVAKKRRLCLSVLSVLVVYSILSFALFKCHYVIRNAARWSLWSRRYKAEVLAQPAPANGELKHIEWDGWGFAGAETNVYLVFDPTDILAAAAKSHRPGKFDGIPCTVQLVSRMQSRWYAVLFYTDEGWGGPNDACSP